MTPQETARYFLSSALYDLWYNHRTNAISEVINVFTRRSCLDRRFLFDFDVERLKVKVKMLDAFAVPLDEQEFDSWDDAAEWIAEQFGGWRLP